MISESFALFFENKVKDIVDSTGVNPDVYNGIRKMNGDDSMFMTRDNIIECISGLKIKNTEGYDRIPQRILVDGRDSLIDPLTELFRLIYRDKSSERLLLIICLTLF